MKSYLRKASSVIGVTAALLSGCAIAPVPTVAPTSVAIPAQPEVEYKAMPTPAPTATVAGDAVGPSTGGTDEPNDQPYGDVFYDNYGVNPRIDTEDDHLSTFAVDVDTASYTVMRRMIGDGYLPDKDSIRVEEFVNFFDQGYEPPSRNAFAIHIDGSRSPYAGNYHLVRVGLQGYVVPEEERPDVVLTFVIDVSGSMDYENRLALVKDSLEFLVRALRPTDKVGIVAYGSRARVVLDHIPVRERRTLMRAIRSLRPEGATNAEEGLVIAYRLASRAFNASAINRVILCSDGVANVGRTGPESILEQIREYAEDDIYLTTVGFGMGNYNDVLMEQLADDGDGFYAYVDDSKEAERLFVHDLTSSLQVIARDAKVQVEFNPDVVSRYRLIGYENRHVADEDFRNDTVDAGEIGPGHSVTALYEIKFSVEANTGATAMTVYLRWEDPDSGDVIELNRSVAQADLTTEFQEGDPRFQLAVVVAQYAEVLRESYWANDAGTTLEDIALEAHRVIDGLSQDEAAEAIAEAEEFARLAWTAVGLATTQRLREPPSP